MGIRLVDSFKEGDREVRLVALCRVKDVPKKTTIVDFQEDKKRRLGMESLLSLFKYDDWGIELRHRVHFSMDTVGGGIEGYRPYCFFTANTVKEGLVVFGLFTPEKFGHQRHAIMGRYLGYPDCCIQEHSTDITSTIQGKSAPVKEKKNHPNQPHDGGCVRCLKCLEKPEPRFNQLVQAHRTCPQPYPTLGTPTNLLTDSLIAYIAGDLKNWSPNTSTKTTH